MPMNNKHFGWLIAFGVVAALAMWAAWKSNVALHYWTKPWPMPILGIWFALETSRVRKFARNTLLSALGFATVGDVLLMFANGPSGALFFLLGLGAFLFTHIFYTGYFFSKDRRKHGFLRKSPPWGLPIPLCTAGLVWWLWPDIPAAFDVPVIIYAAAITAMALSVVHLYGQVSAGVFRLLLAGALLFLLSDSLLAINKFGHPFPAAGIAVLSTYYLGQLGLILGARQMAAK